MAFRPALAHRFLSHKLADATAKRSQCCEFVAGICCARTRWHSCLSHLMARPVTKIKDKGTYGLAIMTHAHECTHRAIPFSFLIVHSMGATNKRLSAHCGQFKEKKNTSLRS